MGTKNNPGDYDCYENAEDDEPMFVLLARDSEGALAVRQWVASRATRLGIPSHAWHSDPKLHEALVCADAMQAWRQERGDVHREAAE